MAALTAAPAHAQPTVAATAGQKTVASRIAHLSHEYCATERNLTQKAACEKAIVAEAQAKVAGAQFASAR